MLREQKILYSTKFYLSDEKVTHLFLTENILIVIAGIGGIHRILMIIFKIAGSQFNANNIMAKYIRSLYFIKKGDEE